MTGDGRKRRCASSAAGILCIALLGLPIAPAAAATPSSQSGAKPDKAVACPSREFPVFLRDFAEDPKIQRAFTRLPLTYGFGVRQLMLIGKMHWHAISNFDEMPLRDPADGNRILPSPAKQAKNDLTINTSADQGNRFKKTVSFYVPINKTEAYLTFRKNAACWFLVKIEEYVTMR